MKSVDVPATTTLLGALLIYSGAFVMFPILVIAGLFWFYDFVQTSAEERRMQRHQPTWAPREIPQCDKELWERITDGCPEGEDENGFD